MRLVLNKRVCGCTQSKKFLKKLYKTLVSHYNINELTKNKLKSESPMETGFYFLDERGGRRTVGKCVDNMWFIDGQMTESLPETYTINGSRIQEPTRAIGFYSVRFRGSDIIAFFNGNNWLTVGDENLYSDDDFQCIGEREYPEDLRCECLIDSKRCLRHKNHSGNHLRVKDY